MANERKFATAQMIPKQLEVSSKKIENEPEGSLSKVSYRTCIFCDKLTKICADNYKSCIHLSRTRFYCPFCLRNNFHLRSSRNVLIFSYRAIIGYYYFRHYRENIGCKPLWLFQIEQFIDTHQKIGLRNPTLSYDPETYLWFADFNKIGMDNWKAPIGEVLISIKWMLTCFEIDKVMKQKNFHSLWERYEKAFKLFYEQRQRPSDRRMLIPTLKGIGNGTDIFFEETRNFVPDTLNLKA